MKKIKVFLFVLLGFTIAHAQIAPGDGLRGEYYQGYAIDTAGVIVFDNLTRSFSRIDTIIDYWNGSSGYQWAPVGGYSNNYSVKWEGEIYIEKAGRYGFGTISDDGSQIFIDDQLIVNNGQGQWYDWQDNISEGISGPDSFPPLNLSTGFHKIKVAFYEAATYDGIELWWVTPDNINSSDIPWYGENFHDIAPYFNNNTNWELVSKKVLFTNHSPIARPDTIFVKEDSTLTFNPLLNDYDPDSTQLFISTYQTPEHGTLNSTDNSLVYYPFANFFGEDHFYYVISDSIGASDSGRVFIQVTGENDPPAIFSILTPADSTVLDTSISDITFSWSRSTDADNDTLSYHLRIFNNELDTVITITDTSWVWASPLLKIPGTYYNWTVSVSDTEFVVFSETYYFELTTLTSTEESPLATPLEFQLDQNWPNPFNPITHIEYRIPSISHVNLSIYNLLGQKVANLVNKKQVAGVYQVEWDGRGFASGVYICTIETNTGYMQSRKLVLLK